MVYNQLHKWSATLGKLLTCGLVFSILLTAVDSMHGQVARGKVIDAESLRPVGDVTITSPDQLVNIVNNDDGTFEISSLDPGRYVLTFQHLQYLTYTEEVQLNTGKELVIEVRLVLRSYPLDEITVSDAVQRLPDQIYKITEEETRRYPGTFFDPARFAQTFPGVQIVNDQANQLVINGMSPELMQWHIEGLEVVNPNHLANAGTVFDRPTATGGGVNMLSNQVLSNSTLTQGSGSGINNATSGVMNMHFRNGNEREREHTVQLGLLGLEGATEGPFKKGGKSSYLLNMRYSTIGLLSAVGVDFGDEMIQFGDVSLQTNFDLGAKGGTLNAFAVIGRNSNNFDPKESEDVEEEKDLKEIKFSSGTEIIGAVWNKPIGTKDILSVRTAYSARNYNRDETSELSMPQYVQNEDGKQSKWSSSIAYTKALPKNHSVKIAVYTTYESNDYEFEYQSDTSSLELFRQGSNLMFRPYASFRTVITNNLTARFGLGLAWYERSDSWNIEPEVELTWQINAANALIGRYRTSSQSLNELYLTSALENSTLEPLRAHQVSVLWQRSFKRAVFELSGHFTSLFNAPVTALATDYSPLNLEARPSRILVGRLTNDGEGETFAINAGYRRNFNNSYYVNANAGFISSNYIAGDLQERSTTFDIGYNLYVGGGKEWAKKRDFGLRTWGVTAGYIQNGGMNYGTIDEDRSQELGITIYERGSAGANQLGDYIRLDTRIYWRKDKVNKSTTWSLDIQNLLGIENEWFPVWDDYLQAPRPQSQLGLIPVLSWRLDF